MAPDLIEKKKKKVGVGVGSPNLPPDWQCLKNSEASLPCVGSKKRNFVPRAQ